MFAQTLIHLMLSAWYFLVTWIVLFVFRSIYSVQYLSTLEEFQKHAWGRKLFFLLFLFQTQPNSF